MGMLALFGVLAPFLQAAATRMLYLALHLEGSSFPRPLTAAQEKDALAALQAGDPAARDTLIRHNLRLVAHLAKKYYPTGCDQDDLVSIGTVGLIKAAATFRPERGARFAGYAARCIENEMRMHLRRLRREPPACSLEEPLEHTDGGALTLADLLPDAKNLADDCEQADLARRLHGLLGGLDDRTRQLLAMRYGLDGGAPLTQQEAADRLGISRRYVSRLEKRALEALRAALEGRAQG